MNPRLEKIFGPFLFRTEDGFLSRDGSVLPADSLAINLAEQWIEADPQRHADEIAEAMRPLCRTFDKKAIVRELGNLGSAESMERVSSKRPEKTRLTRSQTPKGEDQSDLPRIKPALSATSRRLAP